MKIIVLGTIFPNDESIDFFLQNSKGTIPSTGSEVQASIIRGMEQFYDGSILVINAEPIGTWPKHFSKIILRNRIDNINSRTVVKTVGCINLPAIKQFQRYIATYALLKRAIKESGDSDKIEILMYHFYQPHMRAALRAKKHKKIDLNIIIADLPNDYGIGYNTGNPIIRLIRRFAGNNEMKLAKKMDKYILFTKYMSEPLEIKEKPTMVMEGICSSKYLKNYAVYERMERTSFLYSGNLSSECGIDELLDVFSRMDPNVAELHLYGFGSGVKKCVEFSRKYPNIVYHEPVSSEELCAAQQRASFLINPRKNEGKVIKYFFPSKTFGYMASGRPMIGYWLDCFPEEYKDKFIIIDDKDPNGLENAVISAIGMDEEERSMIGKKAKTFVEKYKNETFQAKRVYDFLQCY